MTRLTKNCLQARPTGLVFKVPVLTKRRTIDAPQEKIYRIQNTVIARPEVAISKGLQPEVRHSDRSLDGPIDRTNIVLSLVPEQVVKVTKPCLDAGPHEVWDARHGFKRFLAPFSYTQRLPLFFVTHIPNIRKFTPSPRLIRTILVGD